MKVEATMKHIEDQFTDMLQRGTIPVIETALIDGEYLTVSINVINEPGRRGVTFEFDTDGKPTFFSGETRTLGDGHFLIPFDRYFDQLDHYLEQVSQELNEGFLLPNGLFV